MATHTRRILALAVASAVHAFDSSLGSVAAQSVSLPEILRNLAGTWKAATDKTPRETALDEQVFGRGAFSVRNVTLTIHATGDGILRVHTAVVSQSGRVYAPSLIEVQLRLAEPVSGTAPQIAPAVSVVFAVKRALDPPYDRWPVEGARLTLSLPDVDSRDLNIQFDTKDGRDGFDVTLTRRNEQTSS